MLIVRPTSKRFRRLKAVLFSLSISRLVGLLSLVDNRDHEPLAKAQSDKVFVNTRSISNSLFSLLSGDVVDH